MDTQAFQRWLAHVSQLSSKQKSALHQALQEPPTTEVLDSLPALQNCPHCQAKAEHLAPWGWSQGLRRFGWRLERRSMTAGGFLRARLANGLLGFHGIFLALAAECLVCGIRDLGGRWFGSVAPGPTSTSTS